MFVTDSTRELNSGMQIRQKETLQIYRKYDEKIEELYTYHQSDKLKIEAIQNEIYLVKSKYCLRSESKF